jgi:hypothetical protein
MSRSGPAIAYSLVQQGEEADDLPVEPPGGQGRPVGAIAGERIVDPAREEILAEGAVHETELAAGVALEEGGGLHLVRNGLALFVVDEIERSGDSAWIKGSSSR